MTSSLFGSAQRSVWFTADHHFGHQRIIDTFNRPFESVAEMNKTLIDQHNMLVEEQDIVWIVGGITTGDLDGVDESLSMIKELNGTKYLIAGAPDRCFAGSRQVTDPKARADWVARYEQAGIKHVTTGAGLAHKFGAPVRVRLGGHAVDLAAFPYEMEGQEGYRQWMPRRPARGRGSSPSAATSLPWLVHGYGHHAWRVQNRQINVSLDLWNFSPVSAEMVTALIEEQDEQAS